MIGFAAKRELPIVGKIAAGSLRNKLLILLPVALALSYFLPWTITPLLMFGGAYLCYEGTEKVLEAVMPHRAHAHEAQLGTVALNAKTVEDEKVASAIKTDFILSAEIMAITLAALPAGSFVMQAAVLAVVGIGITVAVYGVVALIVKADDFGVALASNDRASSLAGIGRAFGRALVRGMPVFLTILSVVGTAAMIWVGGGIVLHGLEVYGPPSIGATVHAATEAAAHALPSAAGALEWIVEAAISGRPWIVDWRGHNPDRWICLGARLETAEAFSAGRCLTTRSVAIPATSASSVPGRGDPKFRFGPEAAHSLPRFPRFKSTAPPERHGTYVSCGSRADEVGIYSVSLSEPRTRFGWFALQPTSCRLGARQELKRWPMLNRSCGRTSHRRPMPIPFLAR